MTGFTSTRFGNLLKNKKSKIYYVRASAGKTKSGKRREVLKSLKTKVETVARIKMPSVLAQIRGKAGKLTGADLTLGECAVLYIQSKEGQDLKPQAIRYRNTTLAAIKTNWPDFDTQKAATVTMQQCEAWDTVARTALTRRKNKTSPTWFNGQLQTLQGVLDQAVKAGCMESNPAKSLVQGRVRGRAVVPLKHAKVFRKTKSVYTREQMELLWKELKRQRGHALIFCRFLYNFSLRLDTVNNLTPAMVDRGKAEFNIPGQFVKNHREGETVTIPIFPAMFKILDELDKEFGKNREKLLPIKGCIPVIKKACEKLNLPILNHHSFRHIFTTHALEAGFPPHIVAKWRYDSDNGAMLLKNYAHVLDTVSKSHAAKLRL